MTLPVQQLSTEEQEWRLMERKALAISKGGMAVPKAFQGRPADILAVWMTADELGISRGAMLRSAFVVNGKVQMSGDLLLAVAQQQGLEVDEAFEKDTARCVAKRGNKIVASASFSIEDAQQAGLWQSSDPWKKYPKQMLKMRARGFCLRSACAGALAGVYAPGELMEGDMIDITPEDVD